jgi:hypothetical protein
MTGRPANGVFTERDHEGNKKRERACSKEAVRPAPRSSRWLGQVVDHHGGHGSAWKCLIPAVTLVGNSCLLPWPSAVDPEISGGPLRMAFHVASAVKESLLLGFPGSVRLPNPWEELPVRWEARAFTIERRDLTAGASGLLLPCWKHMARMATK